MNKEVKLRSWLLQVDALSSKKNICHRLHDGLNTIKDRESQIEIDLSADFSLIRVKHIRIVGIIDDRKMAAIITPFKVADFHYVNTFSRSMNATKRAKTS